MFIHTRQVQNYLGPGSFFLQIQTFGLKLQLLFKKTYTLKFCYVALIFYDHLQPFRHGNTKFLK